jgi:hypothetical protein
MLKAKRNEINEQGKEQKPANEMNEINEQGNEHVFVRRQYVNS